MNKVTSNEVKRGQTISFRVPSNTPDHILKHLQRLKEIERRNFASKIAEFVMQAVGTAYTRDKETITIPLPKPLSKIQRDWLKHEHSEVLLGSIVYQLIMDPVRATSLLASINSKSLDINEALYLQEETIADYNSQNHKMDDEESEVTEKSTRSIDAVELDDDLSNFDWEKVKQAEQNSKNELEVDNEKNVDELLGAFLTQMNK